MKTTKTNTNNNTGMGMLLVLFSQDKSTTTTPKLTFQSPSKSLLSKAQSTISICVLLFFTTLLLFTLSTLPNTPHTPHAHPNNSHPPHPSHFALQRMGTLHRRGTKSMSDLLICHVPDDTPLDDFRLFLRLLHRSSLTASSDVVFIFPSPSSSSKFTTVITQENLAFSSLLQLHAHLNSTRWRQHPKSSFNPNHFLSKAPQRQREPLWGPKTKTNSTRSDSLSYGSVLSFDATELDPENSLAGFLDRVPLKLRRWACYPMLLGRVRRNFRHVILADVKTLLILKDPLHRVRTRSPESVLLFPKHVKRTTTQRAVLSSIIMGGARGVRRLSSAFLVEIVRAATQTRKRKNSVSESTILSQLVGASQFLLKNKNINLIAWSESIPEAGAASSTSSFWDSTMVQRDVSNHDLNYVIRRQMCSSVVDSSVYRDC